MQIVASGFLSSSRLPILYALLPSNYNLSHPTHPFLYISPLMAYFRWKRRRRVVLWCMCFITSSTIYVYNLILASTYLPIYYSPSTRNYTYSCSTYGTSGLSGGILGIYGIFISGLVLTVFLGFSYNWWRTVRILWVYITSLIMRDKFGDHSFISRSRRG